VVWEKNPNFSFGFFIVNPLKLAESVEIIDSEKTWFFYSFILKLFSTSESTPGLL